MALPVIRGTSAALYPFTQTYSFLTLVGEMQNSYQQRSIKRFGLVKFEIPYPALTQAQKNTVKDAVRTAKGQFATTLTLTLGGITYTNLSLDSDTFEAVESITTQYSAPLKLSQVIPQGLSPGTSGTAFPTLANGAMGILPYTQGIRFQSIVTKMEAGPKQIFSEFAGGLTGYPSDGLRYFRFDESHLSDADLATRVAHFVANFGRGKTFAFVDEDAVTYSACHYSMDDLVVNVAGVNNSSLKISIEATNN